LTGSGFAGALDGYCEGEEPIARATPCLTPHTLLIVESPPGADPWAAEPLVCSECGREPRPDENAEDEWRTFYQGVGDGVTLCPECEVTA